jgi:hypothetical protein
MMSRDNKFLNCREWRTFLNSADQAGPYPSVAAALKTGRAWLSGSAATSYSWVLVNGNLIAGAGKNLGI